MEISFKFSIFKNVLKIVLTVFVFSFFAGSSSDQKSVEIIVQYEPEECYQQADDGDVLLVHYTGYFESGETFDSSRGKSPLSMVLGGDRVIEGFNLGIKGMCIGEKRRLTVPPPLAYGKNGYPPYIPPYATLTFDIELLDIKSTSVEEVVFRLLRFLVAPVAAICIVMYLYSKYQKLPTKKKLKEMKRNKKKN